MAISDDSFASPGRPAPPSAIAQPAAPSMAAPPSGGGLGAPMPALPPEVLHTLAMFAHHLHGAMQSQQQPQGGQPQMPQQGQGMPPTGLPNTILGQSIGQAMQPPQMPAAQQAAQAGQTPGKTDGVAPPPGSLNNAPMPHPQPQFMPGPSPQGAMPPARPAPSIAAQSPQQQPVYQTTQTYHQPVMTKMQAPPMPAFPENRPVAGTVGRGR